MLRIIFLLTLLLASTAARAEPSTEPVDHTHLLFAGERTWDLDDVHSEWYRADWGNYWDPPSWTDPNYLDGNIYLRFEVLAKKSDATLNMQLCLWYGDTKVDGKCEYCLLFEQFEPFQFTRVGEVVYLKYPPVSEWTHCNVWIEKKARPWDPFEGFNKMLFQMRLGRQEVKLGEGRKYLGEDTRNHVPVTWKAEAYVVPKGESFIPPETWENHPWND